MSLTLSTIKPAKGSKKSKKIIGRGGKRGTYSGRGLKGQKARSGTSGFKRRGMKQLIERTPKLRGFKSRNIKPEILNLSDLNKYFKDGDKVNLETLQKTGVVDRIKNGVKILGKGELKVKNLEISQCEISKGAREMVEKLGGSVK